jgi:hypothetical protein
VELGNETVAEDQKREFTELKSASGHLYSKEQRLSLAPYKSFLLLSYRLFEGKMQNDIKMQKVFNRAPPSPPSVRNLFLADLNHLAHAFFKKRAFTIGCTHLQNIKLSFYIQTGALVYKNPSERCFIWQRVLVSNEDENC